MCARGVHAVTHHFHKTYHFGCDSHMCHVRRVANGTHIRTVAGRDALPGHIDHTHTPTILILRLLPAYTQPVTTTHMSINMPRHIREYGLS
jgi:hypothetical protein